MELSIEKLKDIINKFNNDEKTIYFEENDESVQIDIYDNISGFQFGKMYQINEIEGIIHTSKVKLSLKLCHHGHGALNEINFFHVKNGWVMSGLFHLNYEICNKDGNPLFKKILDHDHYLIYPSKIFIAIHNLWSLIEDNIINLDQAQQLMNEIGSWIDTTYTKSSKNIISLTDGANPFRN